MMHHLLSLLLCVSLLGQSPVVIQNSSGAPHTDYVFVGMPRADLPAASHGTLAGGGFEWRWARERDGVRVQVVSLPAGATVKLDTWTMGQGESPPFQWQPHLATYWSILVPSFELGGVPVPMQVIEEQRPSHFSRWWHLRWHWPDHRVTVECWLTIHHLYPSIEYALHATYGTTANDGQAQEKVLPPLTMVSAGPIQADFYQRLGVAQHATYDAATQRFTRVVVPQQTWHRARRYSLTGAVLTQDDPGTRHAAKKAAGLYLGWDGKWLAHGAVPAKAADFGAILAARRNAYLNQQLNQPRDRAQPANSGQTGEQPEFGAANDLAVTSGEAWEIHDAIYHVMAHALRPTANKEPGGRRMSAVDHPQAQTYNQRPDLLYGLSDRLGWPGANQITWITGYTTSDDEHRADGLLHAYIALSRDPWAEAIVRDHIELDGTDVYRQLKTAAGGPVLGAPRATGRVMLSQSNQVWLDINALDARRYLNEHLERVLGSSVWQEHNGPVKTLGSKWGEAKYGWRMKVNAQGAPVLDANGKPVLAAWDDPLSAPIRGWQPWQEAIAAVQGLMSCYRVTGDERALNLALRLCHTVVECAFYCDWSASPQLRWRYCYSLRFNNGQLFPPSSYSGGITADTYTDGATDYWAVPAAILLANRGDLRAAKIVAAWQPLRVMAQARWWALQ